jgi:hypothetical protein
VPEITVATRDHSSLVTIISNPSASATDGQDPINALALADVLSEHCKVRAGCGWR